MKGAIEDFLAQNRIAVAGVSRKGNQPANFVFRRLREAGYEVFPVNPSAGEVEGVRCYPDLESIPGGVEAVVVAAPPEAVPAIVEECAGLGIQRVWMHRSFGQGSVSQEAVQLARERGVSVIAGGCPLMFCEPVDFGHKCMRWVLGWVGRLPTD